MEARCAGTPTEPTPDWDAICSTRGPIPTVQVVPWRSSEMKTLRARCSMLVREKLAPEGQCGRPRSQPTKRIAHCHSRRGARARERAARQSGDRLAPRRQDERVRIGGSGCRSSCPRAAFIRALLARSACRGQRGGSGRQAARVAPARHRVRLRTALDTPAPRGHWMLARGGDVLPRLFMPTLARKQQVLLSPIVPLYKCL